MGQPDILQLCLLDGSCHAASYFEYVDCWLQSSAGQPMTSAQSYMFAALQERQAHTAYLRRSSQMAICSSMWTGPHCTMRR